MPRTTGKTPAQTSGPCDGERNPKHQPPTAQKRKRWRTGRSYTWTTRGKAALAGATLIGATGAATANTKLVAYSLALLTVTIISRIWTRLTPRRTHTITPAGPQPRQYGSTVITWTLTGPGWRNTNSIHTHDSTRQYITHRQKRGETTHRYEPIIAHQRGWMPLPTTSETISDPLGLRHTTILHTHGENILVWPHKTTVTLPDSVREHDGETRRALHGDWDGIRAYQTGDEPRRVHWKHTARSGELMVRQDANSTTPALWIAVQPENNRNSLDVTCALASSLIAAAETEQIACRLILPNGTTIDIHTNSDVAHADNQLALCEHGGEPHTPYIPHGITMISVGGEEHTARQALENGAKRAAVTGDSPNGNWGHDQASGITYLGGLNSYGIAWNTDHS